MTFLFSSGFASDPLSPDVTAPGVQKPESGEDLTMEQFKNTMKHDATRVRQYIVSFLKWTLIALVTGGIGGGLGAGFRYAVTYVTEFRTANPWMCYLLPVGGVIIAFLYRVTKLSGHADTNLIINSVREEGKVPILLAPVIFLSTVITHLFGGSAGREGAALQLGGCIGSFIGRGVKLDEKDMHLAVMCGMSGLFSALFGTPLTATIFAMEVISVGIIYYSAFLPCIVSALTAYGVTLLCGLQPTAYRLTEIPALTVPTILLVAVIGAAAVVQGEALPYDFILKILFTVITIGFGYKGGEIIPTFFIGATMGALIGGWIGLPPQFAAAIGLVALFCGVVNCPIASLVLSIELFGSEGLLYFAVAICLSYMLSGYYGLYSGQKIMYSKRRARYINRNAK